MITSSNIERFFFVYSNACLKNLEIALFSLGMRKLQLRNNFTQYFCHMSVLTGYISVLWILTKLKIQITEFCFSFIIGNHIADGNYFSFGSLARSFKIRD